MKRILFIDDSSSAIQLADTIADNGYDVHCVTNLCDAEYRLLDEPGADNYDIIILDLDMKITDLPNELHNEAKITYAGWVFYLHIISKYPSLYKKTIIYTGYAHDFMSKIETEKRKFIYLLDKGTADIVNKTLILLNEINKEY